MKIKSMTFRDSDIGIIPDVVSCELTIEEAVWVAQIAGKLTDCDKPANFDIYQPLVGDVINRYWEDGVNEAKCALGVRNIFADRDVAEKRKES